MLNEIVPKVKKVIELATICNREYEEKQQKDEYNLADIPDIDDLADNQSEEALTNYLYEMSYEEIEKIEAVMILGREKDYDQKKSAEEIFLDEINYIRLTHGKGDKDLAIDYITSKAKLSRYLKDGLTILKCT